MNCSVLTMLHLESTDLIHYEETLLAINTLSTMTRSVDSVCVHYTQGNTLYHYITGKYYKLCVCMLTNALKSRKSQRLMISCSIEGNIQ